MTKALATVAGISLVVLGLLGLFLPVLPGVIPVAVGLTLLARHYRWADRLLAPIRVRLDALRSTTGTPSEPTEAGPEDRAA